MLSFLLYVLTAPQALISLTLTAALLTGCSSELLDQEQTLNTSSPSSQPESESSQGNAAEKALASSEGDAETESPGTESLSTGTQNSTETLADIEALGSQLVELQGLWQPIHSGLSTDLGHAPTQTGTPHNRPLSFAEVGEQVGLGEAIVGGNSHGVGVALVDLNNDQHPDLVVAGGYDRRFDRHYPSLYYQNNGEGEFDDVSAEKGFADALQGKDLFSVAAADYDQDGDIDLYFGGHPRDVLLQNDGQGSFRDVTETSRAGGPQTPDSLLRDSISRMVAFGDVNGDGWPDIVGASSEFLQVGAYLLVNDGQGGFIDASVESAISIDRSGHPCAILWSDYDGDGDQDLWVWNDRGGFVLLENRGGIFHDRSSLVDASIGSPMGIDSADIDRDGDMDYYVSNWGSHPLLEYRQKRGTFRNITERAGTSSVFGWGLAFEDFNLDGWPDLFVAQDDNLPHDAFRHLGKTPVRFRQSTVNQPQVSDRAHNIGAAFADIDGDGDVDAITATTDGSRLHVYRNITDQTGQHWLKVRITRSALGGMGGLTARIVIKTGNTYQMRDIKGGSSRGSQNDFTQVFGLGDWNGADLVAVMLPDGTHRSFINVSAQQTLSVDLFSQ